MGRMYDAGDCVEARPSVAFVQDATECLWRDAGVSAIADSFVQVMAARFTACRSRSRH
jgi:hypothetical protein